ncbi:hypothetical protein PYCC9005_005300 [Savitreella phatthalungensis]
MPFGQLVIGPPGSGKSTYCHGAQQFLGAIGRSCALVNLDPANDGYNYDAAIDVRELTRLQEVMEKHGLGPNGGIVHCLELLDHNFDFLKSGIADTGEEYFIFDCPGQVELFTHHASLRQIVGKLEKQLGFRLVVVHLVDASNCLDPAQYVSALMLSLRAMLQMDLPHINVLSKIDLLASLSSGKGLDFHLDFYTEVQELDYLRPLLQRNRATAKYQKLNEAICDLIQDFSLVQFETLAVQDKRSMARLLQLIDKAGGYAFGSAEISADTVWADAVRGGWLDRGNVALDEHERWLSGEVQVKERDDHDDDHDHDQGQAQGQ